MSDEYNEKIQIIDIPKACEYPGCGKPVMVILGGVGKQGFGLTHNFDKIQGTYYQRVGLGFDYIFVCSQHWSGLRSRYWERVKQLSGTGKTVDIPSEEESGGRKPRTWKDPIP